RDLEFALRAHAARARPSHVVGTVRCAAVVGVTPHARRDAPRGPRDRPLHARQSAPDVRPEVLTRVRPDSVPAAARRHAYAVAPDTTGRLAALGVATRGEGRCRSRRGGGRCCGGRRSTAGVAKFEHKPDRYDDDGRHWPIERTPTHRRLPMTWSSIATSRRRAAGNP